MSLTPRIKERACGRTIYHASKRFLDNTTYTDLGGRKRKGVLGYGEGDDIYIPTVGAVREMFPYVSGRMARGIQKYIREHELVESLELPETEDAHTEMDARIIRSFRDSDRDAYRGAMYVIGQRNDEFGRGVKRYLQKYLNGEETEGMFN